MKGLNIHSGAQVPSLTDKLDAINDENQKAERVTPRTTLVVKAGRMGIGNVIRPPRKVGYQTTVLVCGPGGMADEATRQVVNCVKDGFRVDLIEEVFA